MGTLPLRILLPITPSTMILIKEPGVFAEWVDYAGACGRRWFQLQNVLAYRMTLLFYL